jgi:hypothetical protein
MVFCLPLRRCDEVDVCQTWFCVQVNTWDDHDTFDGWGSYPANIQTCPLFQMLFQQSQRFYLLFQHGTSAALALRDGYVVNPGNPATAEPSAFHFVSQLGPSAFVVAPDSRSQRTRGTILTPESTKRLEVAVRESPSVLHVLSHSPSTIHVVVST